MGPPDWTSTLKSGVRSARSVATGAARASSERNTSVRRTVLVRLGRAPWLGAWHRVVLLVPEPHELTERPVDELLRARRPHRIAIDVHERVGMGDRAGHEPFVRRFVTTALGSRETVDGCHQRPTVRVRDAREV